MSFPNTLKESIPPWKDLMRGLPRWRASSTWRVSDIPDQTGRRVVVTGATSGLGENVAVQLARCGADVVLAGRNEEKLARTLEDVRRLAGADSFSTALVDLADLSSVRSGAAQIS